MTGAVPPTAQATSTTNLQSGTTPTAASGTHSPSSGAVPAQLPVRSYASATKTASTSSSTPAGVSAPSNNAKPSTESPVNGSSAMAQGGSQAASAASNGTSTNNTTEHGRKPSVIISASGASGSIPNGGPVNTNGRPSINFGSMNSQGSPLPPASVPYQSQTSSLPAPQRDPRVISPSHSPSPIPQPAASGGRPPSGFQNQTNGMTFGSIGGDSEQMRQNQMQPGGSMGPGIPMHERRTSSQNMHNDPNMGRGFPPGGRGRGGYPGQYGMPSPRPNYQGLQQGQQRPGSNMPPQFQGGMPPGSPYQRTRNSPAPQHPQPNMQPQHMGGNPNMGYGGYPQMGQQGHQGMYPYFDPSQGYYPQQYWNQQASSSPRPPSYPSPFQPPQAGMGPPFHPPAMSRSASQVSASDRPNSSMGLQPGTPQSVHPPPSQPPTGQMQQQPTQSSFTKPKKGSSAIKITNPITGEALNPKANTAPSPAPPTGAPVIVGTPSAQTPPPRAPSAQHDRTESKSTLSAEEKKRAFQEEVRRRQMAEQPKAEDVAATKAEPEAVPKVEQPTEAAAAAAANDVVKDATVDAEKAAAVDAGDKEGEKAAETAATPAPTTEPKADEPKEETEEERQERMIAEMEAAEAEEEERERAYAEKKRVEKEAQAKLEAERNKLADEELKRQEREAEEREEQREREREAAKAGEDGEDQDDSAKDEFSKLKKATIGPGASGATSGADTPISEDADAVSMPPPAQAASATASRSAAQKPKPAHLKLETTKRVEPAEPTPGMQALKSARFLQPAEEPTYPDGFKSPNPALNQTGNRRARAYDRDFLLQFQKVFKEKPSVDWDQKVKDTLGADEPGSARPGSARTPSNVGRSASGRPGPVGGSSFAGPMGAFGSSGTRTLPPGTTSQERFQAASQGSSMRPMSGMQMGRVPSSFGGMPQSGLQRVGSAHTMSGMVPGSPRQGSSRGGGKGTSRRGDRALSKKEEAELAAKMPLTAHLEVKGLEKSATGWKPTSIGQVSAPQHDVSGNMAPDMVQRKVKAALNKMTPSTFEKISDQILAIAGQSKNETDGRTLRQVIQLTFEKACDEAHWAGMYAQFCAKMLQTMSPEIRDETIVDKNQQPVVGGALFRKYLLNRCQEEFERGWQVNLPDKPEGDSQEAALLSDEYYVAAAAKRRGLGLIQFIGQLYKLRMLTLRIMHECVMKLLDFEGDPDEAAVENLTTLLKSVGATMESDQQGTTLLDKYFERIEGNLLKSDALPSRPRFMLLDLVDLRKQQWKGKDDQKGPKTIQQIHEEAQAAARAAEQERARTSNRGGPGGRPPAGRGDARNFSGGMPPPQDFKSNMLASDDLRKLQNRPSQRTAGAGSLGPGGSLGPSTLGARAGSRRGNLGPPSSGNTTRTNTPPVDKEKKEESAAQNTFSALANLDPDAAEDGTKSEAASPPAARNRSKSPLPADNADDTSNA